MKLPVLQILLGLTLCGVSGALLYIYVKTNEEDDQIDSKSPKITKSKQIEEKEIIVELTIKNDVAPIVVGRGGANISSIEEKTGTVILFREKDENNQICEIRGKIEAIKNATKLINLAVSRPPIISEDIYVPQTACGKIIGRCGDSLQDICRKSCAKVSVESGSKGDGNTRRVIITGTQSQVNVAKSLIEEKVKEDVETRKLVEEMEAKREPRGSVRSPLPSTGLTPASSKESLQTRSEKLHSTSTGGQLEVYVSAVASPAKFWLQMVGPQSSELDILVDSMTEYYNHLENEELHKIAEPYLGQIVAAMFKFDSKWYRAEIVAILPNEYSPGDVVLDLYFVDYGDSEYIAPHEVRELRTDFLTLRFQAIECYLANVKPTNRIADNPEIWDDHSVGRFEELTHVAQWKKLVSRVVTYKERTKGDTSIRREGSPVPGVELYDSSEGRDVNIALQLVDEGFAFIERNFQSAESSEVLRLDGGTGTKPINDTNSQILRTEIIDSNTQNGNQSTDTNQNTVSNGHPYLTNEKFSAIIENTVNENFENFQRDFTNNSTNGFLEQERFNGNMNGVVGGSNKITERST